MLKSKILIKKRFDISEIQIQHIDTTNRKIDSDIDQLISQEREEHCRYREEIGDSIRDGKMYRIENLEDLNQDNRPITLKLNTINFRYAYTIHSYNEYYQKHSHSRPNHLSTTASILTTDGKYIFGKRLRNGSIDMIGGLAQPQEQELIEGYDFQKNIEKEIYEELGVGSELISSSEGIGFVYSYKTNILLVSEVKLSIDSKTVLELFKGRKDQEMQEPVFVDKSEIKGYMQAMTSYRKLIPELLGI